MTAAAEAVGDPLRQCNSKKPNQREK